MAHAHAPKLIPVTSLAPPQDISSKPAELIRIRGHEALGLNARRAITILWHNAHRQGIVQGKDYTIELDQLVPTHHKGREWAIYAIEALMKTVLVINPPDGSEIRVQFLGGNVLDGKDHPKGVLVYSFDKRMLAVLETSLIWGKIPLTELAAFGCKYSIPLFENLCQLSGLTHKGIVRLMVRQSPGSPLGC